MKKYGIIGLFALAVAGFFTLTSADEPMSEEQKQQFDQIDQMVKEQTDAFKAQKDTECRENAMNLAKPKADSIIAATAAAAAKAAAKTPGKVSKPAAKKPAAKPAAPKKETVGQGKPKLGGQSSSTTVGQGKPKLGGEQPAAKGAEGSTIGQGKPKLGGK
ncbi:MAG TPA: hypothetical protein PKN57_04285 [Saprospiraceae bacterium]|nr:hypothetical protein [Saprospiraceae bacterium]HND96689.1 hypothetical protein [Chitinophagaceae bacterium]HMX83251.1 hypothetical protein [Saprospiraceae bacterium]HMZ72885.1 hypothetical protein [Saprospiraceae bacterium]HNA93391.1 hypothetical protein [Saprospiraceae bacterium]